MSWYKKYLSVYDKPFGEVPEEVVSTIASNIACLQSDEPTVTVSVIAYNEERHLAACLWSLSEMKSKYSYEITVVNNNSTDSTAEVLKRLQVTTFTETQKGPGHARNCGLRHARGKYFLCIDADTLYPPSYLDTMVEQLQRKGVACAYGLWSFLPDKGYPRWQLAIHETFRDLFLLVQNIKRPELCVRGMAFAFPTELGRKTGFRNDILRGEDGSMALALKPYGKLRLVTDRRCRIYTGLGTLKADGSFFNSFKVRFLKALKNVGTLFTRKEHYEDQADNLIKNK